MRAGRSLLPCLAALLAVAAPALAGYPFPNSLDEKQAGTQVLAAVRAADQDGVKALTALLDNRNPRIQAAGFVGLLRLSHTELDVAAPLATVRGWAKGRPPYVRAALKVAAVALDHSTKLEPRLNALIAFTQSEEGFERRMAAEALRGQRERAVLRALEAMANDGFEDRDGDFDAKAVSRTAFEAWWDLRSKGVDEDERPPILVRTLPLGEPFRSRWGAAACELLEKEGQAAVPLLLALLTGKDRRSRLWAMRALRNIGGTKVVAALQDAWVKDLDSTERLESDMAFRGLLRHPEARSLPRLVRHFVKKGELYAAWQGVFAMGKLDKEAALRELGAVLGDHRELIRTQAAAQLVVLGSADGEEAVIAALGDYGEATRLVARWALPHVKDPRKASERLIELLKVKPTDAKLPEREQEQLRRLRIDLLEEIAAWDRARQQHRPLIYAIRDLLADRRLASFAATALRKMGYTLKWADGKYKVVGSPD